MIVVHVFDDAGLIGDQVCAAGDIEDQIGPLDVVNVAAAADLLQLDFAIYRIAVERGHLVGGFGDVHDIEGADLIFDIAGC
ncbi:MAG: hypothetical protein RIC93_13235, partial [Alphaproteobacteria bacterium]